jgi:hypothetical protein
MIKTSARTKLAAAWISLFVVSAAGIVACSKDSAAPTAATTTATTAATPPKASAAASAPAKDKKEAKATAKAKKSLPADKQPHPVPTDWIELTDSTRGFSFSVPKGTTGNAQDKGGVGVFIAVLPKPTDHVLTCVVAYKDAKKTLDDLGKDVENVITKVFEEQDPKIIKTTDITADYRLVELTSEDAKDKTQKSHWKALLATDVTDNYEMIVGTPEAEFKQNEPTIDEMWGSFDMFSGGASGESGTEELPRIARGREGRGAFAPRPSPFRRWTLAGCFQSRARNSGDGARLVDVHAARGRVPMGAW